MSYIGKTPATGNFVKLDAITTSSTNTYNLLKDSVAFTPESANHMIVSLNGVIQAPSTAFSVSGSTITFIPASGTLSSSDTIDFILVLGNVLDIGTPSDDTISTAKLQNTSVTAGKLATDSVETAKIQNDAVTTDKINLISTSSTPSLEAKGTSGQTDGYIQLNCEQNSHGIKLKSPPHSAGQSYTMVYPATNITAGKFLKVDSISGSGATAIGTMSFADAGGGMWEYISSTTISSGTSAVDFTTLSTDYEDFLFTLQNVHQATDGQRIYGRVFTGTGGSQAVDTGSNYGYSVTSMTTGHSTEGSNGSNHMRFSYINGADTTESFNAEIILYNPHGTTYQKFFRSIGMGVSSANASHSHDVGAKYSQTTAVTGVRFYSQSGNLDDGKISLYGRKNS